jgi:hypothetical protein
LSIGTQAILSPTGSTARIDAAIVEISPQIDAATGGRIIRLMPNSSFDIFPPGRTIDVNIIVAKRDRAILLPRTALVEGTNVVRVDASGRLTRVPVTLLDWPGEQIAIDTGVKAGDRIVLAPLDLKGKTRITPIEQAL